MEGAQDMVAGPCVWPGGYTPPVYEGHTELGWTDATENSDEDGDQEGVAEVQWESLEGWRPHP